MMENLIEMVLDAKSFYVYLGIFMAVLDIIIHFHSRSASVLSNQKMGVPFVVGQFIALLQTNCERRIASS